MKVILLETMSNLGSVGDVVDVRPGYARNFLLPQNKATSATARNVKNAEHQKLIVEHKLVRARKASEEMRKKMEKETLTIKRKAGKDDKIFGAVTPMDIEEALRAREVIVSRKGISIEEPIKKLGSYKIPVKLDGGLQATISVEVVLDTKA